jgi:methanogenic corrinoid protein MtbC1
MSNSHRDLEGIACEDFGLAVDRESSEPAISTGSDWSATSRMQELAATIESAVIPRLLMAHGTNSTARPIVTGSSAAIGPASVQSFVKLLMDHDSGVAAEFVDDLLLRGMPMEIVLLDLMAPAARLLGEMWTADLCDFVDVTLGLSRMQQMLRKFSGSMDSETDGSGAGHAALLVPAPGEQHTFGLRIAEEFLLRDGWDVRCNLRASHAEMLELVAASYYDFIGFTLSGEVLLQALTSAIADARRSSQTRSIRVMVGGVIFSEHPEFLGQVGADAIARDAHDAVRQARQWSCAARLN